VLAAGTPPLTRQTSDAYLEAVFLMLAEAQGLPRETPDAKLKDDWAAATASSYARMPNEMKQQIAGMPLFVAQMRLNWPTMAESEKAKYRAAWAEALKPLLPPPADASKPANNGSSGNTTGSKSSSSKSTARKMTAAEAMAEQNRRFRMHMDTSNAMMNIYKISYNTQANFSGNPWRYW
jgi:hypothetical protein